MTFNLVFTISFLSNTFAKLDFLARLLDVPFFFACASSSFCARLMSHIVFSLWIPSLISLWFILGSNLLSRAKFEKVRMRNYYSLLLEETMVFVQRQWRMTYSYIFSLALRSLSLSVSSLSNVRSSSFSICYILDVVGNVKMSLMSEITTLTDISCVALSRLILTST